MRIYQTLRDFVRYIRAYRKLKYYMDTKYISLGDILYRTTPKLDGPGQLGTWCVKNCIGRFEQIDDHLWAFSRKADAAMFRMQWGDD